MIDKWDCNELSSFCRAKEALGRAQGQPAEEEGILASLDNKGFVSRMYKKIKNSVAKKPNNPI
jgi:hypothetical protein